MTHRHLPWPGSTNIRDLGGLRTADGRETRFGRFVRADNVHKLTRAGWDALHGHGVSQIVDLRWSIERTADPSPRTPVRIVHVPLLGDEPGGSAAEVFLGPPDVAGGVAQAYRWMLDRYRERFGRTIVTMAEHEEGCVVFHCAVGKDRTGLISALILRTVGVDADTVADDYALSEANLASWLDTWIASAADDDERELRRRLGASPREAMVRVLRHVDEAEGGAEAYLLSSGATPDHVEAIRRRLLG